MQWNQDREIEMQPTPTTARARKLLGAALLTAAVLPTFGIALANADTKTDSAPQIQGALKTSAPCHTAPARNSTVKRAGVADLHANNIGYYFSSVLTPNSNGFNTQMSFSNNDGGFSVTDRWAGGDFDGDGDQDLITVWSNGGNTAFALRRSVGNSFVTSQVPIANRPWSYETVWVPGDFDNNGYTDLAAIFHDGTSTSIDVYPATATGFSGPNRWMSSGLVWNSTTKWSVGDFNADGKDDLVSTSNASTFLRAHVWTSTISSGVPSFAGSIWISNGGGWDSQASYVAGDFTGDGKADLAGMWNDGGNVTIAVYVSTGSAFFAPTQWLHTSYPFSATGHFMAGNFNNDNKVDVVMDYNDTGLTAELVFLSTGSSFTFGYLGNTTYWSNEAHTCAGVFNATW